ncbi:hypothetical protein [Erwinia tasmaniensis]|uniref:hypothetical protein n=1 Tax=Erwinia tasmaniensis TaxID=338565 RepID=UPI003A4D8714
MKKLGLVLCLIMMAAGCTASVGQDFDDARLNKIHKGTTTRQEMIALFGQPTSETPYPEGHQILMWTYSQARARDTTEGKTLTVQMENNKVRNYAVSKS